MYTSKCSHLKRTKKSDIEISLLNDICIDFSKDEKTFVLNKTKFRVWLKKQINKIKNFTKIKN